VRFLLRLPADGWWDTLVIQAGLLAMARGAAWLACRVWKGCMAPLAAGAALTILFPLANWVYSPQ
jgi:hypothetical protein